MKCNAKLIFLRPTTNCKSWLTVTYMQPRGKEGNWTVADFGTHYWHRHGIRPKLLQRGLIHGKRKRGSVEVKGQTSCNREITSKPKMGWPMKTLEARSVL